MLGHTVLEIRSRGDSAGVLGPAVAKRVFHKNGGSQPRAPSPPYRARTATKLCVSNQHYAGTYCSGNQVKGRLGWCSRVHCCKARVSQERRFSAKQPRAPRTPYRARTATKLCVSNQHYAGTYCTRNQAKGRQCAGQWERQGASGKGNHT